MNSPNSRRHLDAVNHHLRGDEKNAVAGCERGCESFDDHVTAGTGRILGVDVHRDMAYAEAVELGLIWEEPTEEDPTRISDDVLEALEVAPDEVG